MQELLDEGCDFELDMRPAVRSMWGAFGKLPSRTWAIPDLLQEIRRSKAARIAAAKVAT
jgi:hypothetical protein